MPTTTPAYDKDKFKELILYVANKSEKDERFGATKLNKLLFFVDFMGYAELGHALTGARYRKIERGPAAAALVPIRDEMVDCGDIKIKEVALDERYRNQVRIVACRKPRKNTFTDDEREVIDSVIERFWEMNGAEISRESYKEPGVQLAQENEDIPYSSVFLDLSGWNDADTAEARKRMKARGWAA